MNLPADLRYARSHEWFRPDGTIGITHHAQMELTDIVYVELPTLGAELTAGQQACVVESVKAASDIYAPVGGTVIAINDALKTTPELVNTDPYGEGWIFRLQPSAASEAEALLSPDDYAAHIART